MQNQRLAYAAAAEVRPHEHVLEIDAVPAAKRREIEKPDGETRRLSVPFGEIAIEPRLGREQRLRYCVRRRVDFVPQLLVVGQRADEIEHQRGIGRLSAADRQAHTATSALMSGCGS